MPYTRKSTMILPFRNRADLHLRHRAATCTIWTWPPRTSPFLLPQRKHLLPAAVARAAVAATRVPVHPRAVHHHPPLRKDHPKPILLRCPSGAAFLLRYQIEAPGHLRCRRDPTSKMLQKLSMSLLLKTVEAKVYQAENLITSRIKCRESNHKTNKKQLFARAETLNKTHYPNHT